jgi:hypothetical protein
MLIFSEEYKRGFYDIFETMCPKTYCTCIFATKYGFSEEPVMINFTGRQGG